MIDPRAVQALAGLIRTKRTHQRACLIGGQALLDLYGSLRVRIGPHIPAVRASSDLDLLLALGMDAESDRALSLLLNEDWTLKDGQPATYVWRRDTSIELDLATTYDDGEETARTAKITASGTGKVRAYRMIPLWLYRLNLIEPCHTTELRTIGLERLRHGALLVSKLLAVDASMTALATPEPPSWTARLSRDLADVLYLTDRSLRQSLWDAACQAAKPSLQQHLAPVIDRLRTSRDSLSRLDPETQRHYRTMIDGFPFWWNTNS